MVLKNVNIINVWQKIKISADYATITYKYTIPKKLFARTMSFSEDKKYFAMDKYVICKLVIIIGKLFVSLLILTTDLNVKKMSLK